MADKGIQVLAAMCVLMAALTLAGCSRNDASAASNDMNAVFRSDKDNDGVIDAVYYYTYSIRGNDIKVEIDSDNNGKIDTIYSYNLGSDKTKSFLPSVKNFSVKAK